MSAETKIVELPESAPRLGNAVTRWVGRLCMSLSGWSVTGAIPDVKKIVVAVAPHTSNWDFFVAMQAVLAMGLQPTYLGKHTIFRWPVKRLLLKLGGVPVNREQAGGIIDFSIAEIAKREKIWMCVAPEGTRSKVIEWKKGFLRIAYAASLPVYPVGIDYARKVVEFGKPFHSNGDFDTELEQVKTYFLKYSAKRPENQ